MSTANVGDIGYPPADDTHKQTTTAAGSTNISTAMPESRNSIHIHSTLSGSTSSSSHEVPIALVSQSKSRTDTQNPDDQTTIHIVPRNQRRGLFSKVVIFDERTNPLEYPPLYKNTILILIAYAAIVGPMGGSVFLPAMDEITEEFHVTKDAVNISYGIYALSLALFPLWWSSFSEQFGRRSIYLISFTAYLCFAVGCALVKNIGSLMILRFLAGGCAASVQAVGAGTLADIYIPTERGSAMGYFYLGPLLGPLVGPIFGGLIVQRWGWRGTQWFLAIIAGTIILLVLFLLPETLHARTQQKSSLSNETDISLPADDSIPPQNEKSASDENNSNMGSRRASLQSRRRFSISSIPSSIVNDDPDNSNVGDAFVPIIPSPSRSARASVSRIVDESNGDIIKENSTTMDETAYTEENTGQFDKDLEAQDLEKTTKIATTASEKERRLINSSGQVDFQSLTLKEKMFLLIIRPLYTFKFLQFPPVALTIAYGSLCFMILYFLNVGLETLYAAPPYNFGPILIGLTYIPNSLGYVISSLISGRYSDHIVKKEKAKNGFFNAESRFASHMLLAMALYPVSVIMFGWTANYTLHWIVPLVATLLFGLSSMVVLSTSATYLIDALPGRGSSGIALNNFIRFILAAVATFIAQPMKVGMGFGWMYTFLGLLALCACVAIFAIRKWGDKWRKEADFEKMYR